MARLRLLAAMFTLVFAVGCDQSSPAVPAGVEVSGKALRPGGTPLTGGTLVLRAVDSIHGATAQIQQDGTFTLVGPSSGSSVVPGKYHAYVTFNAAAQKSLKSAVNVKYQSTEDGDSDVIVTIDQPTTELVVKFGK